LRNRKANSGNRLSLLKIPSEAELNRSSEKLIVNLALKERIGPRSAGQNAQRLIEMEHAWNERSSDEA
jgi:hypothetical protein